MKCKHYMMPAPTYVLETAPLSEAVAIMVRKHMQDLMVVCEEGRFVGTITSFGFSRLLMPEAEQTAEDVENETAEDVDNRLMQYLHRRVSEFVDHGHPCIDPEAPLTEALKLLSKGYIRLPVVDSERKLVGALSSLTVLRRFRF